MALGLPTRQEESRIYEVYAPTFNVLKIYIQSPLIKPHIITVDVFSTASCQLSILQSVRKGHSIVPPLSIWFLRWLSETGVYQRRTIFCVRQVLIASII